MPLIKRKRYPVKSILAGLLLFMAPIVALIAFNLWK
jgi:hypothetical protein